MTGFSNVQGAGLQMRRPRHLEPSRSRSLKLLWNNRQASSRGCFHAGLPSRFKKTGRRPGGTGPLPPRSHLLIQRQQNRNRSSLIM